MFWALRGGGAGSWGVITSITVRTFPAFLTTLHSANLTISSNAQAAQVMRAHAEHISDWDAVRAGQYFYLLASSSGESVLQLTTVFPNVTSNASTALMKPFLDDAKKLGAVLLGEGTQSAGSPNILLGSPDDVGGIGALLGSRLIPQEVYTSEEGQTAVEKAYGDLLEMGISGHAVLYHSHPNSVLTDARSTASWDTSSPGARFQRMRVYNPLFIRVGGPRRRM